MVTHHKLVVGGATFAVTLSTRLFPRSGFRVGPPKIAISKIEHPRMVQTLKLLGHVVCHVPNGGTVLIVDLTVVPDLFCGVTL